ncbi:unnamed protein product [Microthlaspi erraticum]|uniref:Uncharacterized protein n=1 Tax=Microthlaspi erraticum TaxID=1685480 RepID=A0A6D2K081_9BRAS|nr:unnamed protein product [Microthlaspi erraticum]
MPDRCRLVWILEIRVDARQQHVWRLTNHNTGGALSIMGKMFSFDLIKICSTWFHDYRPFQLLHLMVVSKNGMCDGEGGKPPFTPVNLVKKYCERWPLLWRRHHLHHIRAIRLETR